MVQTRQKALPSSVPRTHSHKAMPSCLESSQIRHIVFSILEASQNPELLGEKVMVIQQENLKQSIFQGQTSREMILLDDYRQKKHF